MPRPPCCWCGSPKGSAEAGASAALAAARLDVENDQEDSRYENEQETGNESEVVGFHGGREGAVKVSPLLLVHGRPFTARCAWGTAQRSRRRGDFSLRSVLGLLGGGGLRPGGRPHRKGRGLGGSQERLAVGGWRLRPGQHHQRRLHEGLTGQAPGLGTAAQFLVLHGSAGGQRTDRGAFNVNETGDALAAAAAVPEFSLQPVELNPLA